jgi:very-short-patch-repair endonuclease
METRLRLLIVESGLPAPHVQWVVQDIISRTATWLDLAWPELMIGIEYEGEVHVEPARALRDISRYTRLVDHGWAIYRYTKRDVYNEPDRIVAELTRARVRRANSPSAVFGAPRIPLKAIPRRTGWADPVGPLLTVGLPQHNVAPVDEETGGADVRTRVARGCAAAPRG